MDDELRVVLCNTPPNQAESIANTLLEKRLAACVNIVPGVLSLYWWQGKIESDNESTLIIKTRAGLVDALVAAIKAVHPYEVPEVIALPVASGSAAYMEYVRAQTQ